MVIEVDESINVLYSDPSNPNTWTEGFNFHNVENVIVEDEMPIEVKRSHPLLRRTVPSNTPKTNRDEVQPSRNMVVVMKERKRRLAQMESARRSVQRVARKSVQEQKVDQVEKSSKHTLSPAQRLAILKAGFSPKDIEQMSKDEVNEVLELIKVEVSA